MLPDIQFDVLELREGEEPWVHQRRTDAGGSAILRFTGPARFRVRELLRQSGGQWGITTPHRQEQGHWYLSAKGRTDFGGRCEDTHLWVGNARTFLPETGGGGTRR